MWSPDTGEQYLTFSAVTPAGDLMVLMASSPRQCSSGRLKTQVRFEIRTESEPNAHLDLVG